MSPADAATQPKTDERRRGLQTSPGFSDIVLSRPSVPDGEVAVVEITVWGSQADARREAAGLSGAVGVYSVLMQIGETGPPVFGRPLDLILFDSPNVTEPFFRAEVEVFARVSERGAGFGGLLLKNVDESATIPFVYAAQWGSEEVRAQIHQSTSFAAALELARLHKTDVMKVLELQRVE